MTPPSRQLGPSVDDVAQAVSQSLVQAMEEKEAQLDNEIERLDRLDEDDLEVLREKRKQQLLKAARRKAEFQTLGHGVYSEVHDDKEFFDACRKSPKVICHFYKPDQNIERKEIMDKHLKKLAPDLIDTRLICANVEKLWFLSSKLNVHVLPSVVLVKEQNLFHTMLGFEELGRNDKFTTAELLNVFKSWGMLQKFDPDWKDTREEIVEDPNAESD